MRVAVLGATGYTGLVLLRLLADHPDVDDIVPVSSSQPGVHLDAVDHGLSPDIAGKLVRRAGSSRRWTRPGASRKRPASTWSSPLCPT